MTLTGIARQIWDMKYRPRGDDGAPLDATIEDTWSRVARAAASVEADAEGWADRFYAALEDFRFLPAGRILAGAGTGRSVTLGASVCRFGYRDSVFKQALAGKSLITRVRLRLPRPWRPVLGYLDLARRVAEGGDEAPDARTIFDWVCEIRRAKLPDPARLGNAGSFFKNPVVSAEQCHDIIGRDPSLVHYPLPDGRFKLAAGWLIDACGWKGKTVGHAGVYEKQALVLVNRGGATGAEVLTLARAIQESVYGRFGIRLEPEPTIV